MGRIQSTWRVVLVITAMFTFMITPGTHILRMASCVYFHHISNTCLFPITAQKTASSFRFMHRCKRQAAQRNTTTVSIIRHQRPITQSSRGATKRRATPNPLFPGNVKPRSKKQARSDQGEYSRWQINRVARYFSTGMVNSASSSLSSQRAVTVLTLV